MRSAFILLSLAAAALVACYGQPYIRTNSEAVTVIITVITVFAGFLIAIIAVIGDPALIPTGSWRVAENRREVMESKLYWHFWLFVLYLITIALLFVGVLVKAETSLDWLITWIERAFLFVGVFSFLLSFALPWSVVDLQRGRIEAEIERRRRDAGIPPNGNSN